MEVDIVIFNIPSLSIQRLIRMKYFAVYLILIGSMSQAQSFKSSQLNHSRVKGAFDEKGESIARLLEQKGVKQNSFQLFIQAFKKEQELEVWVKPTGASTFEHLITYPFCSTSGTLGPKRREGDLQIPEGIYFIQHFNPLSNFHLSLGINYPNASDKKLSDSKHPGGAIYIHGNCVTIGCIPITDDKIKELYALAVLAKDQGQLKIPVHIFPARLDKGVPEKLSEQFPQHLDFWKQLQGVYLDFKSTHQLKPITISGGGAYTL